MSVVASERPRGIMVPESDGQKFSASLQTPILQGLASAYDAFIYGCNTEEICRRFNSVIRTGWKALCIDGSSFDSTQHEAIIGLIDVEFLKFVRPFIVKHMA